MARQLVGRRPLVFTFFNMIESKQEVREYCRQQFIRALRQIQEETRVNSSEYVLIFDQQTKAIVSSLFTVN